MDSSIIEFESFQGLVVNNTIRIVHGIIFPVGIIISTIFYWGTIYYERYGGDPMKRTIENKLVSAMSFSIIVSCYSIIVGMAWRIQIGLLNDNVAMVVVFMGEFIKTFLMINLSEIIIYQVIISYNT